MCPNSVLLGCNEGKSMGTRETHHQAFKRRLMNQLNTVPTIPQQLCRRVSISVNRRSEQRRGNTRTDICKPSLAGGNQFLRREEGYAPEMVS